MLSVMDAQMHLSFDAYVMGVSTLPGKDHGLIWRWTRLGNLRWSQG